MNKVDYWNKINNQVQINLTIKSINLLGKEDTKTIIIIDFTRFFK